VIGELGAEDVEVEAGETDEVRILRAAARASRVTGAPISLHNHIGRPDKWHRGPDILEAEGADLNRVIAGHVTGVDADFVETLLARGLYAEFDTLGFPFCTKAPPVDTRPNLLTLLELIRRGHADRLLISQDVCTKFQLHKNGGSGYDFVLTDVVPFLRDQGVSEADIRRITIDNPARIFSFVRPGR
jgi:phosphotriesterase-related protein